MLTEAQRRFLAEHPAGRLATADRQAKPHVVPVCYAVDDDTAYITIDDKPKRRAARELKRVRNIRENPWVALVVDHYEDDWTRLGWVMLRGAAEILEMGDEHDRAQSLLRERYPPLRQMAIESLPVIAIRLQSVTDWGNLGRK